MMDKIGMKGNVLHGESLSASGEIDVLKVIAARVNLQWKRSVDRDCDFVTKYQKQQKRQKKEDDDKHNDFIQYDNGKDSNGGGESQPVQVKKGEDTCSCNDDETVHHHQSELEKVCRRCNELESENKQLRGRLVEKDNKFDAMISSYESVVEGKNKHVVGEMMDAKELYVTIKQELAEKTGEINKLEDEKEKFQREIVGLHELVEKYKVERDLNYDLRVNFENEVKGKQKEIEDLRRQLDETKGIEELKVEKGESDLESENLRLKNEISEMEVLFEQIQVQFDNNLKEKNNEVVEMMVEWMENHEVLSKTREESEKLKCENDCLKREIAQLTEELSAKRTEYSSQSNSLKKVEREVKVKINEINRLNMKIRQLTIKHDQKLKKTENQHEKYINKMEATIQNCKDENEQVTKKLLEVECDLKVKKAELELLHSDRDQIMNFTENLKKITSFPDDENFPLVNQLEELTVHIKDKLRLMEWHVKTVGVLRGKGIQIDVPPPPHQQ